MIKASEARAITKLSNSMSDEEKQRLREIEQHIIEMAKYGEREAYFKVLPDSITSLLKTKGYEVENTRSPILEQIGQFITIVKW